MIRRILHIMFIINIEWILSGSPKGMKKGYSTILISYLVIMMCYDYYETFCTSAFFHTFVEMVVGYVLGIMILLYPRRLMNCLKENDRVLEPKITI